MFSLLLLSICYTRTHYNRKLEQVKTRYITTTFILLLWSSVVERILGRKIFAIFIRFMEKKVYCPKFFTLVLAFYIEPLRPVLAKVTIELIMIQLIRSNFLSTSVMHFKSHLLMRDDTRITIIIWLLIYISYKWLK